MLSQEDKTEIKGEIKKAIKRHEWEAIFIHTPLMLLGVAILVWLVLPYFTK